MMKEYKVLKLSEVIEQLQKVMEEHGDLHVMGNDSEEGTFQAIKMEVEFENWKNEKFAVLELN